jgi:hypothetical protein
MNKAKLLIGCAVILSILSAGAQQASAEFKSVEAKSSEGSSYNAALTLKAGGATIECEVAGTKSTGSWAIENEKKNMWKMGRIWRSSSKPGRPV